MGHSLTVVDADDTTQSAVATNEPGKLCATRPQEGRRLGDYLLIAELARGGMGIIYLALWRGELVVLRVLRDEFLDTPAMVAMFLEEGRVASLLNHANIVRTLEVGNEGGRPFIAMEHLEGQSLYQIVQRAVARSKRMSLPMHLRVLLEVLSALEFGHDTSNGKRPAIAHGDVNPHNLFITYDGRVKLIDFGISETFGAIVEKGRDAVLAERVRYMAPEQAAGEAVDGRADLFAAGVMLWEAIADTRPWADKSEAAVWQSLRTGAIPNVRHAWPYIDPTLAAILDRSMTFLPGRRYQTALAMRRDVERYIEMRHVRLPGARVLGDFVSHLFAEDRAPGPPQADAPVGPGMGATAPSLAESSIARKAQTSVQPLTLPVRLQHGSGRSRTMLPIAVSACLGAFIALAVVSATRLRAGEARVTAVTPRASVATLLRPAIPVISIDDVPRVPNTVVAPTPTAMPRPGAVSVVPVATRALPPVAEASVCEPPYTVDPQTGKKQWRLDCL